MFQRVAFIILLFLLCSFRGQTQDQSDHNLIYRLVLKDFLDSVAAGEFEHVALPDSSCEAVFYGGFPDTINKKYFGFEEISYFDAEVFKRDFVASTRRQAFLSKDILVDTNVLMMIETVDFKAVFSSSKQPGVFILSAKGFDKLYKLCLCPCYCEVSKPYFMSETTALIYFHYQCGVDNGFPNIYVLEKVKNAWSIVTKLRSWNFNE